jgi:hypothetical protein
MHGDVRDMITKEEPTYWVKIYSSGSIEAAKEVIRKDCLEEGLCVTIEPTLFIYSGGEELGYVIGLINYPRFPATKESIFARAHNLAEKILAASYQRSILIMSPERTVWINIGASA